MKEFIEKLIGRLEEKFKYNSQQAEIYRKGSDKDEYFREKKDLYMDRANTYGELMRIVNQLAEEYKGGWMEELLEAKKNCGEDSDCSQCPFGQIEDRCILAELQTDADNNGWISCSERLPEDDRDVLVMMPDGSMMVDFRTASSSGWFWSDNDCMPLAWHELPQPYQPKGEYGWQTNIDCI